MQQAALRAQQAVVGRLLDEGVAEAVAALGALGHLLQEVFGAQFRQGGPSGSSAAHTAVSSEKPNSVPSTDAGRTASRAAGLSRSTRDRTRRSSTWGTCWPAVALIRQTPCSRTRALVSSSEVSLSSRNSGLPSTLASTASRTSWPRRHPSGTWPAPPRPRRATGRGRSGGRAVRSAAGWPPGGSLGPAGRQHEQAAARSQPGQLEGEHAATNLANDYYDFVGGIDRPNSPGVRSRHHPLVRDTFAGQMLHGAATFWVAAIFIGTGLGITRGWPLTALTAVGVLAGFFYSAGPLRLKGRALGELTAFLVWGPLMVLGVYFVQTMTLKASPQAWVLSVVQGLWVALVLLSNNIKG